MRSKLILAFRVEQPVSTVVIGLRNQYFRRPAQIPVVGRGRVNKFLDGIDTVFLQHHHEHLGVHERASVEEFHFGKVERMERDCRLFCAGELPARREPKQLCCFGLLFRVLLRP